MNSKAKGKAGENQASEFLESQGFEVLESNYRYGRGEIDLIALWENQLLVFVEVKMRSRSDFGMAEEFVSENQQSKIRDAADHYIHAINWQKDIRFDIITIDSSSQIRHIEDAFC